MGGLHRDRLYLPPDSPSETSENKGDTKHEAAGPDLRSLGPDGGEGCGLAEITQAIGVTEDQVSFLSETIRGRAIVKANHR